MTGMIFPNRLDAKQVQAYARINSSTDLSHLCFYAIRLDIFIKI